MSHDPDPPQSAPAPPSEDPASRGSRRPCDIDWQNPNRYPEAGARRHRAWLERVTAELVPGGGDLAVRFTGDRELHRLNAAYRRRDRPTDVLTFPGDASGDPEEDGFAVAEAGGERHVGDIVISVPAARRQAAALGHDVDRELRILLLHGLLHCLGHDHETDDGAMDRLERRLRRRFLAPSGPGQTAKAAPRKGARGR